MRRPELLLFLFACACARAPAALPAMGRTCASNHDCNQLSDGGTLRCGRLRLCVAGRCEISTDGGAARSWLVICDDSGTGVRH